MSDENYKIDSSRNASGTAINPATEENQDQTLRYQLSNYDVSTSIVYIGKVDENGMWMIKQINTTTGAARYIKGDSDYPTNWSDRASQPYDTFDNIF